MRFFAAFLLVLAACATAPEAPPGGPAPPPPGETAPAPAARTENVAVAGLVESARADAAAGKLSTAAASIERALRIEPRNPRLWQELARVRLQQMQYDQVESTARRSNGFAGNDNALRAENWRLIAQALEARGDADGARAARESAEKFSQR
ncbi:MAG TPA: tetratricopeptide repeat protein [Burkholderiales bacterium]|jgi:predicted Zn-dependent protease